MSLLGKADLEVATVHGVVATRPELAELVRVDLRQHDNGGRILVPHHAPEILHRALQRVLCYYVLHPPIVALKLNTKVTMGQCDTDINCLLSLCLSILNETFNKDYNTIIIHYQLTCKKLALI